MILGEYLEGMTQSERLWVREKDGTDVFRGFVGNFQYAKDAERYKQREIESHGLNVQIFRKEVRTDRLRREVKLLDEIPVESISDYQYQDLEMLIYNGVKLKGRENEVY